MGWCLFIAVFLFQASGCAFRALTNLDNCTEPKDLGKKARRLYDFRADAIHPSIYNLPIFLPDELALTSPDTKQTSHFLLEDRKCPEMVNNESHVELDRSTCPSYHVITHDKNRAPATMVEVECKCNDCLSLTQQGAGDPKPYCQKIYYYTPVLRKVGTRNGKCVYKKAYEPISVGCTCVHPQLHVSRPRRHSPRPAKGFIAA